jgi:hypothetical protein
MSKLLHGDVGILNLVNKCRMNCGIIIFFNIQHKICGRIVFCWMQIVHNSLPGDYHTISSAVHTSIVR